LSRRARSCLGTATQCVWWLRRECVRPDSAYALLRGAAPPIWKPRAPSWPSVAPPAFLPSELMFEWMAVHRTTAHGHPITCRTCFSSFCLWNISSAFRACCSPAARAPPRTERDIESPCLGNCVHGGSITTQKCQPERESRGTPDVGEGDGVAFDIIIIRTEAVTEIPRRFYSFHLRF
jgi:hypothetical protein